MVEFKGIKETKGWFQESGSEDDVVLSSRVRLSRNISGYHFPETMVFEEEKKARNEIIAAFTNTGLDENFYSILMKNITPTERRMLHERNYISQDFLIQNEKALIISSDQVISGTINEIDHLRLSAFHGGLNLKNAYLEVERVESLIEGKLEFAADLQLGYLSSEIINMGTALRASVLLHLPALTKTGIIEKALKTIVQTGLSVKGFFGDDDQSLGKIYQISNELTFGVKEMDIIEKLESIILQFADYERKARLELLDKRRIDIEDSVFRAYGILKNCRLIGSRESIEHIMTIRMGIALKLIDFPISRITALLMLTQKSHIQQLLKNRKLGIGTKMIDYIRAEIIRETLA